ncbi:alpha/beta fold hydrolase [Arthrobacter sp. Bz4]|uniref:alpha/beta hydrolase n=1 Tax=Arthrobacter sp. Bz4 TaxID=2171979 RepID=UPI000D520A05|nr:alpha/beta fold hydrolase [Arthrobacter sp. Bz4]PVE18431.1 alpha/beta hydrolase [Arthrobacter sp. Bz4]
MKERFSESDEVPTGTVAHAPVVTVRKATGPVKGVVLVLHGGRANSFEPVRARHLSPVRMVPFAALVHSRGKDHGLAVWSLRNSVRGWNGQEMSPLHDARWALAAIRDRHPGVPVYLVGHSMGGLVALCVADDPEVRAVASLAPWLSETTPADPVAGKRLLILHGDSDRWTSHRQSLRYAHRARSLATDLHYVTVRSAGHFMVKKARLWHELTASFVLKSFTEDTGAAIHPDGTLPARDLLVGDQPLSITV